MPALASATYTGLPATGAMSRFKALLQILRPANLVTSAADILTAGVVVAAPGKVLGVLTSASVCLYAGGVILNDVFDLHLDALERPERPLPSGRLQVSTAAALGAVLLLCGIALACSVSPLSGTVAALLAATILLYDAFAKPRSFGPVVMASCRALNLLLGLSLAPASLPHLWPLALLPFVYILAITTLSRGEVHGGSTKASRFALLFVALVIASLCALGGGSPTRWIRLLPFVLLFAARVLPPLWRAYRDPAAGRIRAAVHAGIVSLIVLDASLAAAFGGIILGAAILSLSVLATELARLFPVT